MKYQPTLSIDSVEQDLQNYEYTRKFDNYFEFKGSVAASSSFSLPSPSSLPSNACFIELISGDVVSLSFNNSSSVTLTKIQNISGNFTAYNFSVFNASSEAILITWRCFC
jgi:hypothetical protein